MTREVDEVHDEMEVVKSQGYHDSRQRAYEREQDYGKRPLTMDALGMWLPIGLTAIGVIIAIISSVAGVAITNASRLSIIETLMESSGNLNSDQNTELRRLNDIYERQCRPVFEEQERARARQNLQDR